MEEERKDTTTQGFYNNTEQATKWDVNIVKCFSTKHERTVI